MRSINAKKGFIPLLPRGSSFRFKGGRGVTGFTLIELLVVIAIIGILASVVLASLNSARLKSRDARRISDVKQLQLALELYFNDNATYVRDGYSALAAALVPNQIPSIPQDPLGATRTYVYQGVDTGGATCTLAEICSSYVLRAHLEENNPALTGDIDGTIAATVDCGASPEVTPNWYYCVRP